MAKAKAKMVMTTRIIIEMVFFEVILVPGADKIRVSARVNTN